jgi:hypothetical protein
MTIGTYIGTNVADSKVENSNAMPQLAATIEQYAGSPYGI